MYSSHLKETRTITIELLLSSSTKKEIRESISSFPLRVHFVPPQSYPIVDQKGNVILHQRKSSYIYPPFSFFLTTLFISMSFSVAFLTYPFPVGFPSSSSVHSFARRHYVLLSSYSLWKWRRRKALCVYTLYTDFLSLISILLTHSKWDYTQFSS